MSQDYKQIPIAAPSHSNTALDYHLIPIDLSGKLNQEGLVPVTELGIRHRSAYAHRGAPYHRRFDRALPVPLVRESVAIRLSRANELLAGYGVELLIWDGFRPVDLQAELWKYFIDLAGQQMPQATGEELTRFVGQYWSNPEGFDPDDFRTWPTHSTGGAVDLTLQDADGQDLFMGSIFDDMHEVSSTRYFEEDRSQSLSSIEARQNRRVLYHAMSSAGFVNYHHEWWHYDFGTQMAVMNAAEEGPAVYGRAPV